MNESGNYVAGFFDIQEVKEKMKRNQMIQNQAAQDRSMRDRTTGSRIPHMEEIAARDQGMQRVTLAAEMYYLYDMSQKEIADRLGVSRPWVSKLLKRARESGLVRIEIRSPLEGTPELEAGIRDHYGIDRVTVVRPLAANVYTNLNMAAASYLAAHIRAEDVVGVSWGMSIAQTIRHIIAMNLPGVRVVPVVGGAGSEAAILSNTNATNLAETLGASCMLLHAGACCADRPERDRVMSNGHVREIIEAGEKADLVLLGIGDLQNSKIVAGGYTTDEDLAQMQAGHVVGDVAFRFLSADGQIADIDFNSRVVGCDLHRIRENAREVIAIAYGTQKAEIIRAALRSGLITNLFTDYDTARMLL